MKKGLRRVAVVAVATLVAAPALATVASATSTFAFDRLQGIDRYATSVATAASFGASTNVILASGVQGHFPDALSASFLAGVKNAPIMATKLDATPANILAQIHTAGATDVWIIGGTGVVSSAQASELTALGYTVHRAGGIDRYATSQAVIAAGGASATHTALLATGVDFPDALGGGALAFAKKMPMAITPTAALPSGELAALQTAGVTNVIALGGTAVVSSNVLAQLTAAGITSTRIWGADRAETSSKLADYMITSQGFSNAAANVASGYEAGGGADALGGAALSGHENRPTLITNSASAPGAGVLAFLTAHANTLTTGHIFGGIGAVTAAAEATMTAAAKTAASNQTYSVTPGTATVKTVTVSPNTAGNVQYSVCGLGTTPVQIALVSPMFVKVTGTQVTFKSSLTIGQADLSAPSNADITVINGVAQVGGLTATTTAVTPSSGCVTFTADSTLADGAVPVVFSAADGDAVLELSSTTIGATVFGAPTEAFGLGGLTTWVPAEAGIGTFSDVQPGSVSLSGAFFTNGDTYYWDANDVFQYDGAGISMAEFASMIGTGVWISGSYNPTPSGVSTFNITDVTETAPAITTAATVVNLDAGAYANDVRIVATPAGTDPDGTTYSVVRAKVATAATTATGATFTAATVTSTVNATTGAITFVNMNVADGFYYYKVKATYPVTGTVKTSVVTPVSGSALTIAAASVAPKSVYAAETTAAGLAGQMDSGDVIKIAFDKPLSAIVAGDTIRVRDADGSIFDLTHGTAAGNTTLVLNTVDEVIGTTTYTAGEVLTVTVGNTFTQITAGTIAGLQYPATIIDESGLSGVGGFWNIAGSTDVTIEQ